MLRPKKSRPAGRRGGAGRGGTGKQLPGVGAGQAGATKHLKDGMGVQRYMRRVGEQRYENDACVRGQGKVLGRSDERCRGWLVIPNCWKRAVPSFLFAGNGFPPFPTADAMIAHHVLPPDKDAQSFPILGIGMAPRTAA